MHKLSGTFIWFLCQLGLAYRLVSVRLGATVLAALSLLEEAFKSVVREIVALSYRFVNGFSALFVAVFFDRSYWKDHRSLAWSDFGRRSTGRDWTHGIQSKLNAVVAREVSIADGLPRRTTRL